MRFRTRVTIFFDRFRRSVRKGTNTALNRTAALIRKEARESLRIRRRASAPGTPPSAHTRGGLREINYFVENGLKAFIGPRKFRRRPNTSRPVPNIHEKGGTIIAQVHRKSVIKTFPERSFMWYAVKRLKAKGKLNSQFRYSIRG